MAIRVTKYNFPSKIMLLNFEKNLSDFFVFQILFCKLFIEIRKNSMI